MAATGPTIEILAETAPIERAAAALYAEMEHMDPSGSPPWSDVSEGERHVFYTYVEVVLQAAGFKVTPV